MRIIGGAHLQCVNNHYAKFEYSGMKTVGVTDYIKHFGWQECLSSTLSKMRKYLSNLHKIEGAHLQCVNNYYAAKFEYKGMKAVRVTEYTKHFGWENIKLIIQVIRETSHAPPCGHIEDLTGALMFY